jgi:hypothetical protein
MKKSSRELNVWKALKAVSVAFTGVKKNDICVGYKNLKDIFTMWF